MPQPGLAGKFFDSRARPLVEVVRDTVGRHDTFALACTAKYYADMGYPGHVNCTDNFNAELSRFGVAPRQGWPALNLFYNTVFDAAHQLISDEPWSRPGDYVLFRASTDLVCASSACPDDIDPANGWVPTDIHVRVYDSTRRFSVAVGHRLTPDSEPVLTKPTAFAARTGALTTNVTEYNGFWLPNSFDNHGPHQEYWACRERVAVMDLSALRKFEVLGPDAEALLQATLTRDIRRLPGPGRLLGDVHRVRRRRRRLHGASPRRQQLPLHRRRPVRRDLAAHPGRAPRPAPGVDQGLDRSHAQPRGAGSVEPRPARRADLEPAGTTRAARPRLVPLPDRAPRRPGRAGAGGLAHRLHRRARLRAVGESH